MPWKLLAFIAVMALVLVFVGFNLDNRCDISLVFVTFRSVPVVITILAAYLLGLLSALVLTLGRRGVSTRRVRRTAEGSSLDGPSPDRPHRGARASGPQAARDAGTAGDAAENGSPEPAEPGRSAARARKGKRP